MIQDFVFVASSWLHFLGRLAKPMETLPYAGFLAEFLAYLKEERGFAEATIVNRSASLKPFLRWLEEKGLRLSGVSPGDNLRLLQQCSWPVEAKHRLIACAIFAHVLPLCWQSRLVHRGNRGFNRCTAAVHIRESSARTELG